MEILTPASPSDLPPLGELVADEPFWRYPPATMAGKGASHTVTTRVDVGAAELAEARGSGVLFPRADRRPCKGPVRHLDVGAAVGVECPDPADVAGVAGTGAWMAFAFAATHSAGPAIGQFSLAHHITGSAAWVPALVHEARLAAPDL
jgi:hypothetical protein